MTTFTALPQLANTAVSIETTISAETAHFLNEFLCDQMLKTQGLPLEVEQDLIRLSNTCFFKVQDARHRAGGITARTRSCA
jgi:hypothetical protein